jgi:hypothetical protein
MAFDPIKTPQHDPNQRTATRMGHLTAVANKDSYLNEDGWHVTHTIASC